MSKMGGFLFITFGVIVLIASLFTINPIWNYGPYDPSPVSAGTQPDWYIGFADGALRLVPPGWEFVFLGPHAGRSTSSCRSSALGLFIVLVADLPLHRGVGHRRQARAPHRTASAQRRDAHRDRRRRCHVLRGAVGRGGLRHHRDALLADDGGRDPHAPGAADPRPDHRVLRRRSASASRCRRRTARSLCTATSRAASSASPVASTSRCTSPSTSTSASSSSTSSTYEPLVVRPNAKGRIPWHENVRAVDLALVLRGPAHPGLAGRARRGAALTSTTTSTTSPPRRTLEIQGAHERAGVPDAPHMPIDDGHNSETAVRPSNVIVPDDEPERSRPGTARRSPTSRSTPLRRRMPRHDLQDRAEASVVRGIAPGWPSRAVRATIGRQGAPPPSAGIERVAGRTVGGAAFCRCRSVEP